MYTRSRNDIRKLKSELQYSEQRRLHAEHHEQEATSERDRLRSERAPLVEERDGLMQVPLALTHSLERPLSCKIEPET